MKTNKSILFFGKANDKFAIKAAEFVQAHFSDVKILTGTRHDDFPVSSIDPLPDYIVSYLSPWIIPEEILNSARIAAINFHPGPPEYPGIGCTNFAIYNEENEYGVTCHHMAGKVDTGKIISVKRFPVKKSDTVYLLTQKCYDQIYELFIETMEAIISDGALSESQESWTRLPYKRKELDALCEIKPEMSMEEISRRVKSTTFPNMPGAYVVLGGEKFVAEKSIGNKINE